MTPVALTPVAAAVAGAATAMVGVTVAVAGFAADTTTQAAPWASYGGTATAVAGLIFVLKKLLDGSLVPQPIATLLTQATQRDTAQAAVAQELVDLVREGHLREDRLWDRLGGQK